MLKFYFLINMFPWQPVSEWRFYYDSFIMPRYNPDIVKIDKIFYLTCFIVLTFIIVVLML